MSPSFFICQTSVVLDRVLQCSLNAEMVCACNQSIDLITLILIFYMQMFGIILILGIGKLLKIVDIPDLSWGQVQKVKEWLTICSSNTEQWLDCAWNTSMESYLREVNNGIPQGLSSVQVSLMPTLQSDSTACRLENFHFKITFMACVEHGNKQHKNKNY